jgi:SAM-dependent methyltransferase
VENKNKVAVQTLRRPYDVIKSSMRIAPKQAVKVKTVVSEPQQNLEKTQEEHIEPVTDDQIIECSPIPELGKLLTSLDKLFADKLVEKKKPTPAYSWSSSRFDDGYLQPSGSTKEERYPKIYDSAVKLKPKAKRVLSFGCSTGEEIFALAKRFPDAEQLIGVDIDHNRVRDARRANKNSNIFFHDTLGGLGKFDVVTALNVFFCLDKPIPKEQWKKTLEEVIQYVAPGGVLMIFKSDHDPMEVLGDEFKAENVWNHTHNRNNKDYFCGYYRKKRKFW